MASVKRSIGEAQPPRQSRPRRDAREQEKTFADWAKKCGALAGFLATCIGVVTAIMTLFPYSKIEIWTDRLLDIVKVNGEQFEFRMGLTLMNKGGKPDNIDRPVVVFKSDRPVINCSGDVFFTDKQGMVTFPLILQKDTSVQLTCVIRWKPSVEYDRLAAAESEESPELKPIIVGGIELTWPGKSQWHIERPFALLAAEAMRALEPGTPKQVYYLNVGDDNNSIVGNSPLSAAPPTSLFGSREFGCRAAGLGMETLARLAPVGIWTSHAREAQGHYAARGEIASGKEIPSSDPNEVVINIRPCGGDERIIFKAPYKKRLLGSLPCEPRITQVEKL